MKGVASSGDSKGTVLKWGSPQNNNKNTSWGSPQNNNKNTSWATKAEQRHSPLHNSR